MGGPVEDAAGAAEGFKISLIKRICWRAITASRNSIPVVSDNWLSATTAEKPPEASRACIAWSIPLRCLDHRQFGGLLEGDSYCVLRIQRPCRGRRF